MGAGLGLVQVGDGECKGTKEAKNKHWRKKKRKIVEKNKVQLLSNIKRNKIIFFSKKIKNNFKKIFVR